MNTPAFNELLVAQRTMSICISSRDTTESGTLGELWKPVDTQLLSEQFRLLEKLEWTADDSLSVYKCMMSGTSESSLRAVRMRVSDNVN